MRDLIFDQNAFEDLLWRVERDRKKAQRIFRIIIEIQRTPFIGIGKPEPLLHEFKGCWSRRIDDEHRLIYQVSSTTIKILTCRYHY